MLELLKCARKDEQECQELAKLLKRIRKTKGTERDDFLDLSKSLIKELESVLRGV